MITNDTKIEIAEKVCSSSTFQNAPTSSALLSYLCKAELESKFLKEGIINIEFFGEKLESETTSPRVRVNMYNLRKKLNNYYENEGEFDPWRINIEKGQYSVSYTENAKLQKPKRKIKLKVVFPYVAILILVVVIVIDRIPTKKMSIWNTMLTNEYPTTLFIGDVFGFRGKTITGGNGWTRDYSINKLEDYLALIDKNPELKEQTSLSDYFYVPNMAVHATHVITQLFDANKSDFKIKFETRSNFTDIKEGNSIYVGLARDKNIFVTLLNDSNPYMKIENNTLRLMDHPYLKDTTINTFTSGDNSDIAIVSKTQTTNGAEQFLFFSAHDIGILATVDLFTNSDSLKAMKEKHLKNKSNFIAVYKAHGHERTDMSLEEIMFVPF